MTVSKSDYTRGIPGSANIFKIHFVGGDLLQNIDELTIIDCSQHNFSTFHAAVRTLVHGGTVEHQRVSLSYDTGTTGFIPAFQLSINDKNLLEITPQCVEWGATNLGLSAALNETYVQSNLKVMNISIIQPGSSFYTVTSYNFVEGILDIDDTIQAGNNCYGVVLSTKPDGKSVIINAFGN